MRGLIVYITQRVKLMLPKKALLVLLVAVILVFSAAVCGFFMDRRHSEKSVLIGSKVYRLESADTAPLRQKGLGGRDALCETCGMLFVFDQPGRYAFWMKDMRFPLTLIWLAGEQVVFVARDVSPDVSYTLDPPVFADRVIEINAGQSTDLNPGDRVRFLPQ